MLRLCFLCAVILWVAGNECGGQISQISIDVVTISVENQYESVSPGSTSALAVKFAAKENWHFYASGETAPGGMNLKLIPSTHAPVEFGEPIFPSYHSYYDKALKQELQVFSGQFSVFLPFTVSETAAEGTFNVEIAVEGAVCSDIECRMPDYGKLVAQIKIDSGAAMASPGFTVPTPSQTHSVADDVQKYGLWFALGLAFVAGLALNIMPCVWPVLPIIVMRIVQQAKENKAKSFAMGLTFCSGIVLFFACLAGLNIVLQVFYGTVLQWGDQFRSPAFVAAMALFLVGLALFMFGVFGITVPSSISGKSGSGSGSGYSGALGMGFLAAILSTPCGFGILAAAFLWAQAQPLVLSTIAILTIGIGMAVPYAVLTSMPALLQRIPKPGKWMELFKQAIGFVLLAIAVKLFAALPGTMRANAIYYAVLLSFCLWMWGGWVSYDSRLSRKMIVRVLAAGLAVAGGFVFLSAPKKSLVDWQDYKAGVIETARRADRPVLIKFTADWCFTCQVVDKTIYSKSEIAELLKQKNVLAVKADTTARDYPATIALKNTYHEPSVPVTVLLLPGENQPIKLRGITFADELKEQLQKIESP